MSIEINEKMYLPSDMFSLIFKHLLNSSPRKIFDFDSSIFEMAEYSKEERINLIIHCLKTSFELQNCPLFSLCFLDEELFNNPNLLSVLDEVVPHLSDHKYLYDSSSFANTCCVTERIDVIEWLYRIGCPMDAATSATVVACQKLEILKVICSFENPCPINVEVCFIEAAENVDFPMLKWLRSKYPSTIIPKKCIYYIVKARNYTILKWLRKNNCEWEDSCIKVAIQNKDYEMIYWLREQNPPCPWGNIQNSNIVVENGVGLINILHDLRFDFSCEHSLHAISKVDYDTFMVLINLPNPCPYDKKECIKRLKLNRKMNDSIFKFLE
jgi:hypothetical protein